MKRYGGMVIVLLLWWQSASAEVWPLKKLSWDTPTDYFWVKVYRDGTLADSVRYTGRQSLDTVLNAVSGRINEAVIELKFTGSDTVTKWTFTRELKAPTTGSYPWRLTAGWDNIADSVALYVYDDTTLRAGFPKVRTGTLYGYDTTITAQAGKYTYATFQIRYLGADTLAAWPWSLDWTDTSGSVVTPSSSESKCTVYGYVTDATGAGLNYATVALTLPDKVNDTCNDNIVTVRTKTAITRNDGTHGDGYFAIEVLRSSCLANRHYRLTISKDNMTTLERNIDVPDSASYRLIW